MIIYTPQSLLVIVGDLAPGRAGPPVRKAKNGPSWFREKKTKHGEMREFIDHRNLDIRHFSCPHDCVESWGGDQEEDGTAMMAVRRIRDSDGWLSLSADSY